MLGECLPHGTETRNNGRARCDEETARPLVRKAGCETNGERDPSPASGATIYGASKVSASAGRPFMKASPNPDRTTLSPAALPPVSTMCVVHIGLGIPRRTNFSKNGHLADVATLPTRYSVLATAKQNVGILRLTNEYEAPPIGE